FSTSRRLNIFSNLYYRIIVKIQARNGIIRFWISGLFFYGNHLVVFIKFHYSITFRIVNRISKNDSTLFFRTILQQLAHTAAVENIIAQNQSYFVVAYELLSNNKCLS